MIDGLPLIYNMSCCPRHVEWFSLSIDSFGARSATEHFFNDSRREVSNERQRCSGWADCSSSQTDYRRDLMSPPQTVVSRIVVRYKNAIHRCYHLKNVAKSLFKECVVARKEEEAPYGSVDGVHTDSVLNVLSVVYFSKTLGCCFCCG